MKTTRLAILATLPLLALAPAATAQSGGGFSIILSTIDGGGGPCAGGTFSLNGTIGQPDVGAMSGGAFHIECGFWPGVTTPPEAGLPFFRSPDEPADTNALQCRTLILVSTPDGQPTPALQWYKDGAPIVPATNSTYRVTNFQAIDAGLYFVEAISPLGVARSRTAIVGYVPDTIPPIVLYAIASSTNLREITLIFNEALDGLDVTDPFSYGVYDDVGNSLSTTGASLSDNLTTIILTTDLPRTAGVSYHVIINNGVVTDACAGNAVPDGTMVPVISLPTLTTTRPGGQVALAWSADGPVFRLQSANALPASNTWTTVPGTPVLSGGIYRITNSISGAQKFYRLISP